MNKFMSVILAAGEGKRMKSKHSKVLHKVCFKPMIEWVYSAVLKSGIDSSVVVVGHRADEVKDYFGEKTLFAVQEQQLGTGHAVLQSKEYIINNCENVLVLCGDTPLITSNSIKRAIEFHLDSDNSATVISAIVNNPTGYGRIVRDNIGNVKKIVEHKDASSEEKDIKEINSGMYCFKTEHLFNALSKLSNNNSQGEYYLTDTLEILLNESKKVGACVLDDENEIIGVNDRVQLAEVSEIMKRKIITKNLMSGVTIIDPNSTYISDDAKIGMDTIIYPGTIIEGDSVIGEECIIGPNSLIISSKIGNSTIVDNSKITNSEIGNSTNVGPFAYIRPKSVIGDNVKIGDFVEIKASVIGNKTKLSHLTYVGDAEVGENCNFGCGVVVVNYDGVKKHKTIVEDNAFIGCNVNLVSPVVVKKNSYVAAGSTITRQVPENSLAIARVKQEVKEDWVLKRGFGRGKK